MLGLGENIGFGLKICSFHRRIQWRNSFCPTRLLLPRRAKNVPKIVPRTWSPRGKLELSSPRGRTSSPRGRTSSPRDNRKTSVLVTSRTEKKNSPLARGDQVRGTIFGTFLALLARRGRVGQNEFHH